MAACNERNVRVGPLLVIALIVVIQAVVNIRISTSLKFDDNTELGLDGFVSAPRADRAGTVTATASQDGQTQTKGENFEGTNLGKEDGDATAGEQRNVQEIPMSRYSYGTTSFEEFHRLHREYLLSQQEKLGDSHLSTKARDKDADGNPLTTVRYSGASSRIFNAGFRNQMIYVTVLVMDANYDGHKQFDVSSLRHKDTYGSEKPGYFESYFDVEHWNNYSYTEERARNKGISADTADPERYPNWLPRMVFYNDSEYEETASNNTRLVIYERKENRMMGKYVRYAKGKGPLVPHPIGEEKEKSAVRNPAEILMLQGALRPHPALQAIVDRSKQQMMQQGRRSDSSMSSFRYMTVHARIEPDMQKHPVCRDKKVLTLQEIVDMIESKWPEPPVDVVFLPINRQYLEKEGTLPENFKNDTKSAEEINWIAVRNLELLNRLTNHDGPKGGKPVGGLWNGKVPVVEFGTEALDGTVYAERPSLSGSILNYFLAIDADIFVGTEVSSFSHDLLGARFYRGFNDSDVSVNNEGIDGEQKNPRKNNYKYLPSGLHEWITDDMVVPPNFHC